MRTTVLAVFTFVAFVYTGGSSAVAQECSTDADCPEGFGCDLAPRVDFDCAPQPCDAGAPPEATGQCEPQEVSCETDADCPEGLVCGEASSASAGCAAPAPGVDAGPDPCAIDEPEPPTRSCIFNPQLCETDADCTGSGYACLQTEGASTVSCSSGGQACEPGQECPPPEEEVCEETPGEPLSYCFPERQDCTSDADCDGSWRCAQLPEDARDSPPAGWEGATQLCVPEGFALLFEGRIELGDSDFGSSSQAASESNLSGSGGDPTAQEDVAPEARGGGSGDDDGGCRAGPGPVAGGGLGAVVLALVSLLRRRRRH